MCRFFVFFFQLSGRNLKKGRDHLMWVLLQFISGSIQKNPVSLIDYWRQLLIFLFFLYWLPAIKLLVWHYLILESHYSKQQILICIIWPSISICELKLQFGYSHQFGVFNDDDVNVLVINKWISQTFYLGLTRCCVLCFVLLAERFQASNEALWSTLSRKAGWLSCIKNISINQKQLRLWLTFLFLFQPLPVPDISVADSVHSLAMSCIWVHLAKKVTLKIISDNSTQYYPFF